MPRRGFVAGCVADVENRVSVSEPLVVREGRRRDRFLHAVDLFLEVSGEHGALLNGVEDHRLFKATDRLLLNHGAVLRKGGALELALSALVAEPADQLVRDGRCGAAHLGFVVRRERLVAVNDAEQVLDVR